MPPPTTQQMPITSEEMFAVRRMPYQHMLIAPGAPSAGQITNALEHFLAYQPILAAKHRERVAFAAMNGDAERAQALSDAGAERRKLERAFDARVSAYFEGE